MVVYLKVGFKNSQREVELVVAPLMTFQHRCYIAGKAETYLDVQSPKN